MAEPLIILERDATGPLYQQIVERLRAAVTLGTLQAGMRLPSSRSLASQLGVARGTVDAAYALLAGEGVLVSHGAAGTIVSPHLVQTPAVTASAAVSRTPRKPEEGGASRVLTFRMGLPGLDAFPRKLWSTLTARETRQLRPADLALRDPAGYRPLREAIAVYLGISRCIACAPEQVWVTGGFQGALSLIISAVLRQGDAVWVEDPGYPPAREALLTAGAKLVPVRVDSHGAQVDLAREQAPYARMALVTPTHQSPLGVALSLQRRLSLLAWAAETGAWVVEDDYDS